MPAVLGACIFRCLLYEIPTVPELLAMSGACCVGCLPCLSCQVPAVSDACCVRGLLPRARLRQLVAPTGPRSWCAIPGVPFLVFHSWCAIPGVPLMVCHSWCAIPGVPFLVCHSWCAIPGVPLLVCL